MRSRSAFAVLGLDEKRRYSEEEVKAAYRRQAKLLHPDAGGSAERFRELHAAYDSLCGAKKNTPGLFDADSGSPFYNNAHSRWSAGRCGEDMCGASFARDDSSGDFNFGAGWGDGRAHANESTRDFYRPYTFNKYCHGFTSEEVLEAERRNRLRILWMITKHGLLWGGLVYFIFAYCRENRICRAVEARRHGHVDKAYWERLREDERLGRTVPARPHWTDVSSKEFVEACNKRFEVQKRLSLQSGGGGSYAMRPVAVSFQGRPFTATGVRGTRSGVPKTRETYESDVHYEPDDLEAE